MHTIGAATVRRCAAAQLRLTRDNQRDRERGTLLLQLLSQLQQQNQRLLDMPRPSRMVKKLMRLRMCNISGAPQAVRDTEWGLYALRLG